jgi:hypothetical protein
VSIKLRTWPFQFKRTVCALMVMPRSFSISMLSRTCADISRSVSPPVRLDQPIGQRRLAVIDVRDDAEIADEGDFGRHIGEALSRQRGDTKASSRYSLPNSVTLSMIPITWSANGT